MRRSIFALAAGMALAIGAHAQVYKWTDPSGKVHYGDRAPDDAKAEQVKIQVRSHEGPVEVTDWAAILRKRSFTPSGGSQNITMYSASWCVHCKRAKKYFNEKGIRFNEVDVEASEANRKEFKELGGGGIPLILIGDKAMRGFNEQKFESLMKKS
jgi:glutaredoxin